MDIDLFSMDKFIELNNLPKVSNPILLERDNIPTTDGLLSYEIFGRTVSDRSTIFGYIDLNGHFLNPLVFKVWKRIDNKIEAIVSGLKTVSINNLGDIIYDENGWTGLEELYNHYDKIKFKDKASGDQRERVIFLKGLKKDEIFMTKLIVCPPFYRDIQLNKADMGKISVHEKTELYSRIIRMANAINNDFSGIDIITYSTKNKIQHLLVECYSDKFMREVKGKDGLFRKFVLGKSIDYGARLVITAPSFDADVIEEMDVSYEYSGLPLAACCTCFFPYFIKWLKDFFHRNIILVKDKYPVRKNKDGSVEYVQLLNTEKFNDDFFTKNIDSFINSYADRFKTIPLENSGGYNIKLALSGQYHNMDNNDKTDDTNSIIQRPLTWTELLYMAAVDICKDKHILITRYPLEDYFGIFTTKITVMSTVETIPAVVGGKYYRNYPKVDRKLKPEEVARLFVDTLFISNLYLTGIGGDKSTLSPLSVMAS